MKYFIDFEATQFSEEIISVGCKREDGETFYALVRPVEGKITPFITNLTGITAEMVEEAMSPDTVFEMFYDWAFKDANEMPEGYVWIKNVNDAKTAISYIQNGLLLGVCDGIVDEISLDHDAGDFATEGGDYIEILNWLERVQNDFAWPLKCKFHIHSMNPVGVQNMRAIIEKNGWREIR